MELFSIHHIVARSGTIGFPKVKPLHSSIACTAYEADKECCPQFKAKLLSEGYKKVEVIEKCIGKSRKVIRSSRQKNLCLETAGALTQK